MSRKVVQIVLTEAENNLLEMVANCASTRVSTKGKGLLLEWAGRALQMRGLVREGICGSRSGCETQPASYYNKSAKFFCCEACAKATNESVGGNICVLADETHIAAIDVERAITVVAHERARQAREMQRREEKRKLRTREDLVDDVVRAAEALRLHDEEKEIERQERARQQGEPNGLFDVALQERFSNPD